MIKFGAIEKRIILHELGFLLNDKMGCVRYAEGLKNEKDIKTTKKEYEVIKKLIEFINQM